MGSALLRFENITKRFPGVTALEGVTFDVAAGECHALVGENGAGKSTLGKLVAGIYQPDDGRILFDGRPADFGSPLDAARAGIRIVHQELAFCPNLSVAENLFLGQMPSACGFVRRQEMERQARARLSDVGLSINPHAPMNKLSTAQEQLVQIAVAVGQKARVVIFDEPTSSLSPAEAERLFAIIGRLKADGVTILYVSHHLSEIMRLTDRVTVLRDGRCINTLRTSTTSPDEIVRLMIGRPLGDYYPTHVGAQRGPALLRVRGLSSPGKFEDISFDVHAGEIVGLAGLVGAGRSEIAQAIFGIEPAAQGTIEVEERPVVLRDPRNAIEHGIGLLPEDRKRQGLVLTMDCKANLTLAMLDRLRGGWLLDRRSERAVAQEYFGWLRIRAPSIDAPVAGLSGGNQQKVALAKWLARKCRVLMLDEPTRGVDVGAKAEIHALIDALAAEGRAVLLISSDLPEVLNLSTRILVLCQGRLVGELSRDEATQEKLMRLMANVPAV